MWRNVGEKLRRYSSSDFQEEWPQENFTKNRRQVPRAMKENSFTARLWELGGTTDWCLSPWPKSLGFVPLSATFAALYCAIRLQFGYGFESCDANGPRNVKSTNLAKQRPVFPPVGNQESVLKVPKRGQFHSGDGRYHGETFAMRNRWRSATAKHATN